MDSFKKKLKEAIDKTAAVPYEPVKLPAEVNMSTDDFMAAKKLQKKPKYDTLPVQYGKELSPDLRPDFDPSGEKRVTKETLEALEKSKPPKAPKFLDKAPKKLNVKGSGKFGALASLLGVGTSLLAPKSAVAGAIQKVGKLAEAVDPSTYLQAGLDDPRNSVEAIKAYAEKAKNKDKVPKLSEESISTVRGLLRGDEDTSSLLGERNVPDMEDGERLYRYKQEDELKRKLGYK
jgi:hypothetical protein